MSYINKILSIFIKFVFVFVFVFVFFISSANAENGNSITIPGITKDSTQDQKTAQPPNPLNLKSKWWSYFDVNDALLASRVDIFRSEFEKTINGFTSEEHNSSAESIESIRKSLDALTAPPKENKNDYQQQAKRFLKDYTVNDLLDLIEIKRVKAEQLIIKNREYQDDRNSSDLILKTIDDLFVKYKKLDQEGKNKIFIGLEIIANRLSLIVWNKNEILIKNNIQNLVKEIDENKLELEFAADHLTASKGDLNDLNRLLEISKNELESSQQRIRDAQVQSIGVLGSDAISRMNAYLYGQNVILAKIQAAINEIDYAKLKIQKYIIKSILDNSNSSDYANDVLAQKLLVKKTVDLKDNWKDSTIEERNRSVEMLQSTTLSENDPVMVLSRERLGLVRKTMQSISILDNSLFDLEQLNSVLEQKVVDAGGLFSKLKLNSELVFTESYQRIKTTLDKGLFSISDVPVTLLDVLRAIFILIVSVIVSHIIRRLLNKFGENEQDVVPPIVYNLGRVLHYVIIFIGFVIALSSIGIGFTNLAIVAGALSVGIGFGLQSIVQNFVSGIIVLFERNIEIGDFIELDSGKSGNVKDINVRSTVVTTLDNLDIIIPNSELVTAKVTNFTMNEQMFRIHVPFGVAYGTDKELVRKAAIEASRNVPVTYDDAANRRPQCWLTEFADSSLNFELVVWVNPGLAAKNRVTPGSWKALYMWEIETALSKYDISIPFPQRDLHIKSGLELASHESL
jgi:small-conductance mechanosensitive channel